MSDDSNNKFESDLTQRMWERLSDEVGDAGTGPPSDDANPISLLGLIDVLDSLTSLRERCEELVAMGFSAPASSAVIIEKQMLQALKRFGVTPMDATGKPLQLAYHQVELVEVRSDCPEDTVLGETRRGYLLNGSVLRYARVIVSRRESA